MLREHGRQLQRALLVVDMAVGAGVFVALVLHPAMQSHHVLNETGLVRLAAIGLLAVLSAPVVLGRCGVYQSQRRASTQDQLARLLFANGVAALVISTVAFAIDAPLAPAFPLVFSGSVFLLEAALRVPVFWALHALRRSGRNTRNVLVIGSGPRALGTKRTIERHPEWGLRITGFIDHGDSEFVPVVPQEKLHKLVDLPALLREKVVDEVLVACPRAMLGNLGPVVAECTTVGVPVTLLTDLFGDELPPPRVGSFDSQGTLSFAPVHHNDLELAVKRGIDIVGATLGLLITSPVLAAAAVAIKLDSRGPVFFKQTRSGKYGRQFHMVKLRTMVADAEARKQELMHLNEMDGPVFKIKRDPRITRVGAFLRKWSIDELPQFWNVLVGHMSLVGPRPPTPDEVLEYKPSDRRRLSMRPGITCLWQISGRNEIGFDEWMELDLEYIDSWSLASDLRILAMTVPQVLLARGAS